MVMLDVIVGKFPGRLLEVGLAKFTACIWVYAKGLCPPKDLGMCSMDFLYGHPKSEVP